MTKLSEQTYFLENGEVLRMTEYDDYPIIGELCNEKGEPYKQYSAWNIQAILKHFKVTKYSISPIAKAQGV